MALLAERNMLLRRAINIKLLRSCLLVFQHQVPTELFTRISTLLTSLLRRSKMFIAFGLSYMALLAERNVLLRRAINIKLLRSCLLVSQHQAPTELFTRISTSSSYGAVYSYLNAVNGSTLVARRAGTKHAMNAIATSNP